MSRRSLRSLTHPRVSDFEHGVAHLEAIAELAHALEHVARKPIDILGEVKGGAECARRGGAASRKRHLAGARDLN